MAFTFFFRDRHTLDLIGRHVAPHFRGKHYVHIWDAGCANGAEPYSLAMILREQLSEFAFRNVRIWATDVDPQFGAIVGLGRYRQDEVRRSPAPFRERYFGPSEERGYVEVAEALRRAVRFQQHDLRSLRPIRDGLALIVCKNVLLHLRGEQVVEVVRMFRHALGLGGFLAIERTQALPIEASTWFRQVTPEGQLFQRV